MSTRTTRKKKPTAQRGFSLMQLMVTLAVVSIVSGLAVLGIASARQRIRLTNSSRLLASYAEKARVDSVRPIQVVRSTSSPARFVAMVGCLLVEWLPSVFKKAEHHPA